MFVRIVGILLIGCCSYAYPTCSRCPARWTDYKGYCYRYFTFKKSWAEAHTFCDTVGARGYSYGSAYEIADLASIHSEEEQTFLYTFWKSVRDESDDRLWIGLNDLRRNRDFQWTDGTTVDYTNWRAGQPNNYNNLGQHYGSFFSNGEWNDISSSNSLAFICKVRRAD